MKFPIKVLLALMMITLTYLAAYFMWFYYEAVPVSVVNTSSESWQVVGLSDTKFNTAAHFIFKPCSWIREKLFHVITMSDRELQGCGIMGIHG